MKSLRWMLPIALAVLVFVLPASAAAGTVLMRADVPFAFVAGDKVLPAGQYVVKVENSVIELHMRGGQTQALMAFPSPAYRSDVSNGRLIFHTYGGTQILRKIWGPGAERGAVLPSPKAEREARARSGAGSEKVIAAIAVLDR